MRVVLDANIYISSLISSKGNPANIVNRWLSSEFDVLISQAIVDEILRVTAYPRLLKKYRRVRENRVEFVELISDQGTWIEPSKTLSIISADETDNRYLECAVAGGAAYIVSGDDHLLNFRSYQGISIVTPSAFVALLAIDRA